jgi:hypothetical protein
MSDIFRILDTSRTSVRGVVEWWRGIRSRNGTDDARRAQASRLFIQQSCAGLPIGSYSCGEISSPHRTHVHTGGLDP